MPPRCDVGHIVEVISRKIPRSRKARDPGHPPNAANSQIVYAPGGGKFAYMNGQTVKKYLAPLAAGAQAVYTAATPAAPAYWLHSDWLGSARLGSTVGQSASGDQAYGPFGETYDATGSALNVFTGQTSDMGAVAGASPVYDFLFRQYSATQGRWMVPDPAGMAAVDITNPQTWNRYAYLANNPLNAIDPLGLKKYCPSPDGCAWDVNESGAAGYGWGDGEFGDYSGGWGEGAGNSLEALWPVFLTGIWDVLGDIGDGGGGGGSASTPYTNPNPTGNGSNNDPYTFHTWVLWPFPSDAQIGPYGPPKPTGWWSIFTTLPGTNYCGPGGRGKPRNGVDELCMEHDACKESSGASFLTNLGMFLQLPMSSHRVAVSNCNQTLCENLARRQPQTPSEAADYLPFTSGSGAPNEIPNRVCSPSWCLLRCTGGWGFSRNHSNTFLV